MKQETAMNLGTYLDNAVEKYRDKPYLQFYDQTLTYREFAKQVDTLANGLKKLGFAKGDFIHVYVQNHPSVIISYFAIQKIGAIAGPINGWWKAPEVEYLLNDSKGRGLIIEDQYLSVLDEIRPRCPSLEQVIEMGPSPRPAHVSFHKLMEESPKTLLKCQSQLDDVAYIFYTSGTTGNPKGVLLTHRNVLADTDGLSSALNLKSGMTALCFLPLFHVNAMLTCVFSIKNGLAIVLRKSFSASEFWQVVDRYKVNFFSAVPAVYQILLTDPSRQQFDLSSLQFGVCGAAPLTRDTMTQFEQTFRIPIVEGYGLTEATCVSTINPRHGERKVGSIGLPLPGQIVKIFDEEGKECPPKKPGEIVISGDAVMQGYFNRPEETRSAIVNGFLHTGDVGYRDEDGYIFIVDRIKEMIIRGGENIYPKELDNVLAGNPKIREAATVGVPDPVMGEEIKAFILAADETLTEEEVLLYCQDHLASYKVPKYVEILDQDLPRNPIGKVLKKVLKQWGITPRPKTPKGGATVADIFGTMESRVNPKGVEGVTASYGYVVTGTGGGEWTVAVQDGKVKVLQGLADPQVTTTVAAQDWIDITLGKLDGMTAFSSGKLKVEGDMSLLMKAPRFFKKYTAPQPVAAVTVADIFGTMESRVNPKGVEGVTASYGYVVTGIGGGEWTVAVQDGTVKVSQGLHDPQVTTTVAAQDWIDITLGKLDGMTAFSSGKLKVEGDMSLLMKAPRFFKKFTPPSQKQEEAPPEELLVLRQLLSIPQRFSTGPLMGKFLRELRDNRRILGNRCPVCLRMQTPPREVCAVCRVRVDELVEVGPEGRIASHDIAFYASPDPLTGESRETPYCSAFLILDGCQGNDVFWHEINPKHIPKVKRGARVRPVWEEKRTGAITDIKYFDVID